MGYMSDLRRLGRDYSGDGCIVCELSRFEGKEIESYYNQMPQNDLYCQQLHGTARSPVRYGFHKENSLL